MKSANALSGWLTRALEHLEDMIVPESAQVKSLLRLEPSAMRAMLPGSPVYSKSICALFDYQNKIVRQIVRAIKYKNNRSLRRRIAGYLYEELMEMASEISLFEGAPPLLLPMPMSKKEKTARGWNQCEELAREIENISGGEIKASYRALKKVRETRRQAELSKEERQENLKMSMAADGSAVRGRVCIVLDDVYTTGASLEEARRALLSMGARRVVGLFIAH